MLAHVFLAVTARASRPGASSPEPAAASGNGHAAPLKRGPDACGQRFIPPRTFAPPAFVKDETGRDLIPLTAADARRLFNLCTRVTRPAEFHRQWSDWRRRRQAAARKSHYARRLRHSRMRAAREQARLVPRRRCCHYQPMVHVTVEARNDVGYPRGVKLQGETWELNIRAATGELWELAGIEKTDWDQRRTLKVGTCANAPVWWSERDGTVDILVGHDAETWDIGVTIPLGTVHELLDELGEPPEVTLPPSGLTLF